ncbi:activator of Hsp90 ATPase [Phlyctochytrium arcticum]|nr:activator of Hsp90 ATPase [Phlyctochytrium arcticum]
MMTQDQESSGTNWKNVNNWHWVEKNCMPWAKEYFNDQLPGTTVESDGVKVEIKEVTDLSGDADINQRKGKIITIFDIALTVTWEGTVGESLTKGKVVIPEYMHDTDPDDIVFDVSVDKTNLQSDKVKAVVKKDLTKVLRQKMVQFHKDLKETHLKDVIIAPEHMKGHPVLQTYRPKPPAPTTASSSSSTTSTGVIGGLTAIDQSIEFVASAHDIFETLLDKQRVQAWTRGKADISPEVGSSFSLFDGNISGTIAEVVPDKKIVQKWRLKSWPAGHFSTVTMTLEEGTDNVVLKIKQTEVPIGEKDITENNWKNYYWNSIKATFGFGGLL